jgi:hypothetical protein
MFIMSDVCSQSKRVANDAAAGRSLAVVDTAMKTVTVGRSGLVAGVMVAACPVLTAAPTMQSASIGV